MNIEEMLDRSKQGSYDYYYTDREILRVYKNFRLFRGTIESVTDPDNLGRLKVRVDKVYGSLSDLNYVSTEDLPWSYPLVEGTDPSSVVGLDDNIFIMFANGDPAYPIYLLGGGGGSSTQADWTESDSSDPSYIKNKPVTSASKLVETNSSNIMIGTRELRTGTIPPDQITDMNDGDIYIFYTLDS